MEGQGREVNSRAVGAHRHAALDAPARRRLAPPGVLKETNAATEPWAGSTNASTPSSGHSLRGTDLRPRGRGLTWYRRSAPIPRSAAGHAERASAQGCAQRGPALFATRAASRRCRAAGIGHCIGFSAPLGPLGRYRGLLPRADRWPSRIERYAKPGRVSDLAKGVRLSRHLSFLIALSRPGGTVDGDLRFERPVQLYVSDRATVGPVVGTTAVRIAGDAPPN
jgi:hypothetical protein